MSIPNSETGELQDLVSRFVNFTDTSVFLTGKAGTGKTTLLRQLKGLTHKKYAIVAPTGVAAINAGGSTIHSFFQIPPFTYLPGDNEQYHSSSLKTETPFTLSRNLRVARDRIEVLKSLELLIIDEISMVRADLLDAIDAILRRYRNSTKPFGGVQLLMIGDLFQLAPVVRDEEARLLRRYYSSNYFFGSLALQKCGYVRVELFHVYRQSDPVFIDLLNEVRHGELSDSYFKLLEQRYHLNDHSEPDSGYITLCTHVNRADRINESCLAKLESPEIQLEARVKGEFSETAFPAERTLRIKEGAQVMFIKNDRERRYYNGMIGTVVGYDDEEEVMYVQTETDDSPLSVFRESWKNLNYVYDRETGSVKEEEKGEFMQFPIRLAWAVTVHKSQGLTFEKARLDLAGAFAPGQVYVALSRCRSLEGLVLCSKLSKEILMSDDDVHRFHLNWDDNSSLQDILTRQRASYIVTMITKAFDFDWLRHQVRAVQEVMISFLKNLDEELAEKLKQLEVFFQQLKEVETKFRPHLQLLAADVFGQRKDTERLERLEKGIHWFQKQLLDNFADLLNQLICFLQQVRGGKSALKQVKYTRGRVWSAIRKLWLSGILTEHYLNAESSASVRETLENKLEDVRIRFESARFSPSASKRKEKSARKKSKEKGSTYKVTLELLRSGKSIREIALERGLKPGTITSHICKLITESVIELEEVMKPEEFSYIDSLIPETENQEFSKMEAIIKKAGLSNIELSIFLAAKRKEVAV